MIVLSSCQTCTIVGSRVFQTLITRLQVSRFGQCAVTDISMYIAETKGQRAARHDQVRLHGYKARCIVNCSSCTYNQGQCTHASPGWHAFCSMLFRDLSMHR